MRRVTLAVAAAVVTISFALGGCSKSVPLDPTAVTCSAFLEYVREEQDRLIHKATDEIEFAYYSPAGAVSVTPWQYLQLVCAVQANSNLPVEQALAVVAPPTCEGFLAAPPQVRREWAELRSPATVADVDDEDDERSPWDEDSAMEALATACLVGGAFDDALSQVANGIAPTPYDFDFGYDYGLPHAIAWTTTSRQGLLVGGVLELGNDVLGGPDPSWGPYGNSLMTAGEGCGYDPTTDAVIAGRIVAINRSDSPAEISVGFKVSHNGPGDTTVAIDSGSFCDTEGDYGYAGLSIYSRSTDLVAPGGTFPIAFFIILRNYFTPAHPNGARGELIDYIATPFGTSPNDDDWIAIGPQDVSLSLDLMGTISEPGFLPPSPDKDA